METRYAERIDDLQSLFQSLVGWSCCTHCTIFSILVHGCEVVPRIVVSETQDEAGRKCHG